MSFCKVLHGIESGNDGDLDTAMYENSVRQGKAPPEILHIGAGSLGYVTASLAM